MKNDLMKEVKIDINKLLLDPNNPRFLKHHSQEVPPEKFQLEVIQQKTYQEMNNEANHFEISELMDAIKVDGFIPVDKIFVKKHSDKYLVIEGNRRITAIKRLLAESGSAKKGFKLNDSIIEEIKKPSCVIVNVDDSAAEATVRKILGLRHHGSILQWKPLPAAFSLYQEYMNFYCKPKKLDPTDPDNFIYEPVIAKKVAATYSVKLSEVRKQIKVFRVYLQLLQSSHESPRVQSPESFSMIQETLSKVSLAKYFGFDEQKSVFSDEGVDKILDLYYGLKDKPAVITQASAGDSNVRDFAYIVESGKAKQIYPRNHFRLRWNIYSML